MNNQATSVEITITTADQVQIVFFDDDDEQLNERIETIPGIWERTTTTEQIREEVVQAGFAPMFELTTPGRWHSAGQHGIESFSFSGPIEH